MPMPRILPPLLALFVLAAANPAEAMRCGNRLVATGDYEFQVRERCGEPYWSNGFSELHVRGLDGPFEHRQERVYEEWFYQDGPRRLVRRVLFADNQVVRIETGGYGVRSIGNECSDRAFRRGAAAGEVFLRCGAPESRNQRYEDVVTRDGRGNARVRPIRREEWFYPFDGSRFVRKVVFHNGVLDRVERIAR